MQEPSQVLARQLSHLGCGSHITPPPPPFSFFFNVSFMHLPTCHSNSFRNELGVPQLDLNLAWVWQGLGFPVKPVEFD